MIFKSKIATELDREILAALAELEGKKKTEEDYGTIVERVSKLHKLKSEEYSGFRAPSLDNMLIVGANIFGILWLTRFEREHVIPSKAALGFVLKPR